MCCVVEVWMDGLFVEEVLVGVLVFEELLVGEGDLVIVG